MNRIVKKFATVGVSVATIASLSGMATIAPLAGAQVDLSGYSNAQLLGLLAQLQALLGGSSSTACFSFTRDLTNGSTGADVTALQDFLVAQAKGPAAQNLASVFAGGVAKGYFGPLTVAAMAEYQASVGIAPPAGYFGPITRAHYNTVCVTSAPDDGDDGDDADDDDETVKSGDQGSMTVKKAASPASGEELFEGESEQAIYGFEVKATDSEIYVTRATLQFNTAINNILDRVYLYRDGKLLAERSVDSDSVNRITSSNYTLQLSGFESVVDQDDTATFEVRADGRSSIDSSYTSFTVLIPANGVRGTDGADVSLSEPSSALGSNSVTVSQGGASAALLTITKSGNSPEQRHEVADSNGKADKVTTLIMNVKAEKDDIKLTDLSASTTVDSGGGTAATAFLYDGSTLVDSVAIASGEAAFTDFDWTVSKGTTKELTLKVDFTGVTNAITKASSTVTVNTAVVAEGTDGIAVATANKTVNASGNEVHLAKVVPVFSLTSATAVKNAGVSGVSSATGDVTFEFTVEALGGDVKVSSTNAIDITPFKDGTATTTILNEAYTVSGATLSGSVYTIAQGTTATFTASGQLNTSGWTGTANDGNYDFRLTTFGWAPSGAGVSTTWLDDLGVDPFKTNFIVLK